MTPAARRVLMAYAWPGNVRELRNTIESMVVIDVDGVLDVDDLTEELQGTSPSESAAAGSPLVGQTLEQIERHYIQETLKLAEGNREEAARLLGIGERTLYRKLKGYEGS